MVLSEIATDNVDRIDDQFQGEFNIDEGTYQNVLLKNTFQKYRDNSRILIGFRDDLSNHDKIEYENLYYLGLDMMRNF